MKVCVPLLLSVVLLVGAASAVSPPRPPPPVPPTASECQGGEGDRWRKDCNWCWCENGGETCTRQLCPEGLPEGVVDEEPECEGNPTWKNDCNTCHCADGSAICTSIHCEGPVGPVQTLTIERRALQCEEGSRWREACNWCVCNNGQSSCTEAACIDWSEALAVEEGIVECHGESRWKKDCNWCNCVNGRGICTTLACIPPERDPFHNLPENAVCVPGSSWKDECNTCSCTETGVAACTLRACIPGFKQEGPTCEEGSIWRNDDCNICRCINGAQACSKRLCREEPPQTKDAATPSLSPQPECEGEGEGNRWRQDCNWCRCGGDGIPSCTKRLCPEGIPDEEPECEGTVSWMRDCNRCHCVNNTAVCTFKFCGPVQARPVLLSVRGGATKEPECQGASERDRWRQDCNWCRCRNGVGACTKRLCPQGIPDDAPECEGNVSWKKDCNTCRCVNGLAVCTSAFCGPLPARPFAARAGVTREAQCEGEGEGNRWRQDCNWCRCRNGVSACTRQLCPEGIPDEEPECEGTVSWMKDCNRCHCAEGRAMCTTKFCGPLPARPFAARRGVTKEAECQGEGEGNRWRQDCNWCRCRNGVSACSRQLCPEGIPDEGPECEGTVSWKKDCNMCHCANGRAACTSKFCGPLPTMPRVEVRRQEEPLCQGDSEKDRWVKDCNWCRCNNGRPSCTKRLCRGGEQSPPKCEGNPTWKDDCNTCHCSNGTPVCTSIHCGGPYGPESHTSVQVSVARSEEPVCEDGSRWRVDCNWCNCEGGVASCTKIACIGTLHDEEPECEGNSTWKNDCNWCSCGAGMALCTKMACLKDYANLCAEGTSWREDCNICRCSHGFAVCTQKACVTRDRGVQCQGDSCGPSELPELCRLPPVSGPLQCTGFFMKWTFSATDGECKQIVYGGCAGTENLFDSQGECESACPAPALTTRGISFQLVSNTGFSGGGRCTLPVESGPCFAAFKRYAYNAATGACEEFLFGGCAGNANNFHTEEECLAECQGTQDTACDKSKCPWNLWGHYLAKECVPQYAGDACCPTSFQCPSASESGKDLTKCYYNGAAYNIGDSVPVEEPCSASCRCSMSSVEGGPAEINCANVECPELFRPPTPGCRPIYSADKCCPVEYDCVDPDSPPLEPRASTCAWGNKTFYEGAKMYFDEYPCRACICGAGFTDPNGPGCYNLDCGLTFRYTSEYNQGCAPIHFEGTRCCPISWMCPDDSRIKPQPQQQPSGTVDESAVCRLGDRQFAVGDLMDTTDCKLECRCVTPPELTCIQYRSCEMAQEVAAERECPALECGDGCHPVVAGPGECPTCSCSSDTFTCPAQTCPSTCRPEVDLQTGCPSCKCQCPPEVPCPMDCAVHTVLDESTGCPRCECRPDSPQLRNDCPVYPGGRVPCPQDCAVIKRVDENGCEVCECNRSATVNPFGPPPPRPPQNPSACRTLPDGRAPCPMDCAIRRFTDENGCEKCECDPNKPGTPFGPFRPHGPPPPQPPRQPQS